jgi:hypothetical protein
VTYADAIRIFETKILPLIFFHEYPLKSDVRHHWDKFPDVDIRPHWEEFVAEIERTGGIGRTRISSYVLAKWNNPYTAQAWVYRSGITAQRIIRARCFELLGMEWKEYSLKDKCNVSTSELVEAVKSKGITFALTS